MTDKTIRIDPAKAAVGVPIDGTVLPNLERGSPVLIGIFAVFVGGNRCDGLGVVIGYANEFYRVQLGIDPGMLASQITDTDDGNCGFGHRPMAWDHGRPHPQARRSHKLQNADEDVRAATITPVRRRRC